MFDVHCSICDRRFLLGTRSIEAFHNTADGPVAVVRCPAGHELVRSFRDGRTVPAIVAAPSHAA